MLETLTEQTATCDTGRVGAVARPDGSVCWRLWAPRAEKVELVLIDGDRRRAYPMRPDGEGFFRHDLPDVPEGQRYAFRLDGGPERADPASRWQPGGADGPSAVLRTDHFTWAADGWRGLPRERLAFYELHVGTFTPEGTFEAAIPRLRELRELGVTAVQVMPVAQFPGGRNWGYDGVFPYAAQDSYGGPHGLQRLVDACHDAGLAAFLDVVYNHLGPEGNYLGEFGPYFTDRHRTAWGPAFNFDDRGSDAVRAYMLDNARMWLEDYRFDGLRLDAVHAVIDLGPKHILSELQETADGVARRRGWPAHLVAESDLNDPRLLLPPGRGGCGLAAQWSDDFHHAVHTFLTGERQGYYEDYAGAADLPRVLERPYLYAGHYSRHRGRRHGAPPDGLSGDRFVVCVQNHDQVGNRARGDRLASLVDPPRLRLAAGLLLLAPHLPLLFMGEEYGEENPFAFFCSFRDTGLVEAVRTGRRREFAAFAWQGEVPDPLAEATFRASKLSWSWPEGTPRAGLRRLYQDLLTSRSQWPALADFTRRAARRLPAEDGPVLELVRGEGRPLRAYFNLTDRPQPLPRGPAAGESVLLRSEAPRYGGDGPGPGSAADLRPWEFVVIGPAGWSA